MSTALSAAKSECSGRSGGLSPPPPTHAILPPSLDPTGGVVRTDRHEDRGRQAPGTRG